MIRTIAAALVTSRLDYANSVWYGIPSRYICRLQRTLSHVLWVVILLIVLLIWII